jgi:hypothetical protein
MMRAAGLRVIAMSLFVAAVSACDVPELPVPTGTHAQTTATAHATDLPDMSVLVALTDSHQKTLTPEGPLKITAGARPTVVAKGAAEQSMVIRDEDDSSWGPGPTASWCRAVAGGPWLPSSASARVRRSRC